MVLLRELAWGLYHLWVCCISYPKCTFVGLDNYFIFSPISGFILKPTQYVTFIREEYWSPRLALSSVEGGGVNFLNWVNLVVDMWCNGNSLGREGKNGQIWHIYLPPANLAGDVVYCHWIQDIPIRSRRLP